MEKIYDFENLDDKFGSYLLIKQTNNLTEKHVLGLYKSLKEIYKINIEEIIKKNQISSELIKNEDELTFIQLKQKTNFINIHRFNRIFTYDDISLFGYSIIDYKFLLNNINSYSEILINYYNHISIDENFSLILINLKKLKSGL